VDLEGGSVQYKNTKFMPIVKHGFTTSRGGNSVAPKLQPQVRLTRLPHSTLERVLEYACFNPEGILIDLDTHTIFGLNLGLFHVDRTSRGHSNSRVSSMSTITIKMTSTKAVTDFDGFALLEDFCQGYPSKQMHGMLSHIVLTRCSGQPVVISLELLVPTPTTLSDVRINIKGMIRLLGNDGLHPKSTIHLTLNCSSTTGLRKEEAVIGVAKLQQGLFLLLPDVFEQGATGKPRKLTNTTPVPDIWIDSHGTIINASSPALGTPASPFSIDFRHTRLRKNEVRVRGYRMIHKLQKHRALLAQAHWPRTVWPSPEHLVAAWVALRRLCWDDWEMGGSREGCEL
jgi:hypothetical protein